jgi:hypothetical protein
LVKDNKKVLVQNYKLSSNIMTVGFLVKICGGERMRKLSCIFVIALLAFSSSLLLVPTIATTPTEIQGQWQSYNGVPTGGSPVTVEITKAGANAFVTLHNYLTYFTGDILGLPGSGDQIIQITFHYSDPRTVKNLPTGTEGNVNSILTALRTWPETDWNWKVGRSFTGTVLGVAGSFTMKLEATGYGRIGNPVVLDGQWTIINGNGGLTNLHGQGTWHSLGTQWNAYEGQVHFDPQ